MMSYSKFYSSKGEIKTSTNVHIMGIKAFRDTVISKFIDTDNKCIFSCNLERIAQMIAVCMRE